MRYLAEEALLRALMRINQLVSWLTRGRVVVFRFDGMSGLLLTVTDAENQVADTRPFCYLADGDDYVVLSSKTESAHTEGGYLAKLGATASATVELVPDETFDVDVEMLGSDADRTGLLDRLLGDTSLYERHEIKRGGGLPVARLRPHRSRPTMSRRPDGTSKFSGIVDS
ncbi:nitroreductase/quinone reductase family protein [Actinomadura rubrisoli]|uniref:DUF385 domain-containing protein n=1 Tax=Actinomadura rubrisoli TaxID=2530368 RepID=A0A4R5BJL0_9ACTN|nr:nitroreductase/quinone reductase family protein [Actinomadura rubrisoli]TDD85160.1 DUF385 domain-containing protein [Actinomadura rubrisoli]